VKNVPFEEGSEQMDFDEFMAWLRPIGAAPICVVNLESGFLRGDVEAGIKEAAAWVRYANVTKKYGVKYWEIGNETDLLGTRYSLTAEQYAQAVVRFSQAMKAVDPTIQIGALGPLSPTHAGVMDRIPDGKRQELQALPAGKRRAQRKGIPLAKEGAPWWPTVCRIAKGHFDFAIIHRYDSSRREFPKVFVPPLQLAPQVRALDVYLKQQFGREMPLALTEWNTWRSATGLGKAGHALTIAEQVGNYLAGGVDMANYWPMRYPRGKAKKEYFRGLLNYDTKEPRAAFYVLKLFRQYATGHVVPVTVGNPQVYGFATHDGAASAVFLVNRLGIGDGVTATISLPGPQRAVAEALVADDSELGVQSRDVPVTRQNGAWRCVLPPRSLVVVRFGPAEDLP
jgi:hypothetical protein